MDDQEKQAALPYGTHTSDLKEVDFIHAEFPDQVQVGHVSVFPLDTFMSLHNLWLSPILVIPQLGQRRCLIFDFIWSGLNKEMRRLDSM